MTSRHVLRFASAEELALWYARFVVDGSVHVPAETIPAVGASIVLCLEPADGEPLEVLGQAIGPAAAGDAPGFRAQLDVGGALKALSVRCVLQSREGRLDAEEGGRRRHARYDTWLKARFRNFQQLEQEFVTNISHGGMFIRTTACPPLHSRITITVQLPEGEAMEVEAEVMRVVDADQAAASGGSVGVGVVFPPEQLAFSRIVDSLIAKYRNRAPRVLVVDDDRLFREMLCDALLSCGMEVMSEPDGARALHRLKETLYELDGVVFDLEMPGVDGRVLIQRIRRLGSEMRLRTVLVSASDDTVLKSLIGPAGADDAIQKGTPWPQLIARVRRAIAGKANP